jgi:hypothetical protein
LPTERTHLEVEESDVAEGPEGGLEDSAVETAGDGVTRGHATEYGRNPAWLKAWYAVALSLLIVVLGLVFFFSRTSQRREDTGRQEANERTGQEHRGADTNTQAVEEKTFLGTASSGRGQAAISEGEGKGSGAMREKGRFPGKEKSLGTGGGLPAEERRRKVPQDREVTAGRPDRDSPAQEAEGMESGRVIEWLLEKRSETK